MQNWSYLEIYTKPAGRNANPAGQVFEKGRKPKKGRGKKGTGKGDTSPQTLPRKKSKRSLLKAANERGKRSPPKKVKKPHADSVVPKKKSKTVDTTKIDSGIEPGKWPRVVSMLVTVGSMRFYQGSTMGAEAVDSSMEVVGIAKKILSVG